MKKNDFFKVMLGISLALALVFTGCPTSGGDGGSGSSFDKSQTAIRALPSFDGSFVTSKDEAEELVTESQGVVFQQIYADLEKQGILDDLAKDLELEDLISLIPSLSVSSASRAATGDTIIKGTGFSGTYNLTTSGNPENPPFSASGKITLNINGTFGGGYTAKGTYNVEVEADYTSEKTTNSGKASLDCVLVVSNGSKGLKLAVNGTVNVINGKVKGSVSQLVYDNDNICQFEITNTFDEDISGASK
jgi:hypothetical protein